MKRIFMKRILLVAIVCALLVSMVGAATVLAANQNDRHQIGPNQNDRHQNDRNQIFGAPPRALPGFTVTITAQAQTQGGRNGWLMTAQVTGGVSPFTAYVWKAYYNGNFDQITVSTTPTQWCAGKPDTYTVTVVDSDGNAATSPMWTPPS